jgi:hypothetical protein
MAFPDYQHETDAMMYTEQVLDLRLPHFAIQSLVEQLPLNRAEVQHDVIRVHIEEDPVFWMIQLSGLVPKKIAQKN